MSRSCSCPVPTAIANIGTFACPTSVGQIQKIAFWRTGNKFDDVADLITLASWTTFQAAVDATHIVISPFIANPTVEPGGVITFGSGNEVKDGIPITVGAEPTKFTCRAMEWDAATHRSIKELQCEDLEVLFFQEDNKIVHRLDGVYVKGFPIQQMFVSDRLVGGFQSPDYFTIEFYLKDGWSDYLTITDPTANFYPLELHD